MLIILFVAGVGSMIALANENTVIVNANTLNVRLGPGLSHDVLTQVHQNDRLQILAEDNQWYQVRIGDDQLGWVASWLVEKEEISQDTVKFGRVHNAPEVNLRQYASTDSEIIGTALEGTELEILYEDYGWYQVLYMGKVAWINAEYIEIIDSPIQVEKPTSEEVSDYETYITVDVDGAAIYAEPTSDSTLLYSAGYQEQFNYLYSEGDWYYVELGPDQYGYIGNWEATVHSEEQPQKVEVSSKENAEAYHARANTNLSEATIVIDAGHGGSDPGALSTDESTYEKDITLQTAYKLQARLQDAGANVIMTRSDDHDISLKDRTQLAIDHHADLFISIHYDSLEVPNSSSGTTTYYYDDADRELADTVNHYLAINGTLPNNGINFGNFYVLRENSQPALLLELGYINHFVDLAQIRTDQYQTNISEAIYQALREFYGQ